jgi:hypothetical protein
MVATALSVNGETGTWYAYVMPKEQVQASGLVLSQAELPAYLTPAAPVWPERRTWRYVDYARFDRGYDYPMIYAANLVTRNFDNDYDYKQFVLALNSRPNASTYLILTDQMQVYCWYFGILPWDALPNLKKRLYADKERWQPFFDGSGITVFVHKVTPTPAPEPAPPPQSGEPSEPANSESVAPGQSGPPSPPASEPEPPAQTAPPGEPAPRPLSPELVSPEPVSPESPEPTPKTVSKPADPEQPESGTPKQGVSVGRSVAAIGG